MDYALIAVREWLVVTQVRSGVADMANKVYSAILIDHTADGVFLQKMVARNPFLNGVNFAILDIRDSSRMLASYH
jgi:hypothetical protein